MESQIIWFSTIVLIALIFIPYVIKFRKRQKHDYERHQEAVALDADKPIAQYPQIDIMKCIGCGTCVMACPEGDVLGIVHGKSAVINGLKCVGHARCAEVCPVNAITVGLGDISARDDIPLMNDANETNLPGLYIAGELGGLALIKNAISRGKRVVDHIAADILPGQNEMYDIIVIGAGPAGISAALTAKQHDLSCLILDQQGFGGTILQYPRKKVVMTHPVEIPLYGWLNKQEYTKEELLAIWNEIHRKFKLNIKIGEKLEHVRRKGNGFHVQTNKNSYSAQRVVLALGRRGTPRKLNVPGEESAKVMYKLIDAESYQNNHILIVGGGDSAVEAAIGLSMQPGNSITISYRKAKFFRLKKKNQQNISELIATGKVRVIYNSNVIKISHESVELSTHDGVQRLQNDYVLIFAGGEPPFKRLKDIGIEFGGEEKSVAA
ncbi:NAD(P)-binding domain-containing protein [candidate division KSB1 bacterium]|nr:NAD(P)-binding domain-containing protein [candidate division KSB1 bacterium]